MITKYTKDGRKVAVIQNATLTDFIVQEIMVDSKGVEYLNGKNEIASNLLDQPLLTWKNNEEARLSKNIERLKIEFDTMEKQVSDFKRIQKSVLDKKIEWVKGITNQEVKNVVIRIKNLIEGKYKYIVWHGYALKLEEFTNETFSFNYENKRCIRLVSLFGVWNKRLEMSWKCNQYQDGSGSKEDFELFIDLESALTFLKNKIYEKNELSDYDYELCIKHGITVQREKNEARIESNRKRLNAIIKQKRTELEEIESELNNIV